MDKELLIDGFISSGEVPFPKSVPATKSGSKVNPNKVLIGIDNFRCTAYPVLEDHPSFVEGHPIYEIIEYWPARPYDPWSPEDLEITNQLVDNKERIVEFRIGGFEILPISSKKRWKRR